MKQKIIWKEKNIKKEAYTQNGSYPSCKPQVVKYLRVLESCPKFKRAFWPAPNVIAGTNPSPDITLSNASSEPDGSYIDLQLINK